MEHASSHQFFRWIKHIKLNTFRRLVYPGFKLSFSGVADWFLFSLFIMPSYFGVRLAFFDLTAVRFFEVLMLCLIWKNRNRRAEMYTIIMRCPHTICIALYMFVVVYTNLIHPSLGTIFYWLMNVVFAFYIVVYLILYEYGITGFLYRIRTYGYILTILSVFELVLGKSPFQMLNTLGKGVVSTVRFGSMRIGGNCTTSNGYAMYLCILLPILLYDVKEKRIDIIKNYRILGLVALNIILSGARLSVGVFLFELMICYIMQPRIVMKKATLIMGIAIVLLVGFCIVFHNVGFVRSLLCTFFSAFDEVFNTNYAVRFGADPNVLYNSTYYRELLFKHTFFGDWLNPFLGRGGNYNFHMYVEGYDIQSCDNYYVGQYITYAYPGLITWLIMSISYVLVTIKIWLSKKSGLAYLLLVSIVGYFLSLWYLDHLQTFPYIMAVFGLVYSLNILSKKRDV